MNPAAVVAYDRALRRAELGHLRVEAEHLTRRIRGGNSPGPDSRAELARLLDRIRELEAA